MRIKDVGDRWFGSRSSQDTLRSFPKISVLSNSGSIPDQRTKTARRRMDAIPFIVGRSVVGGDGVAI